MDFRESKYTKPRPNQRDAFRQTRILIPAALVLIALVVVYSTEHCVNAVVAIQDALYSSTQISPRARHPRREQIQAFVQGFNLCCASWKSFLGVF